jgi:hypothetical protein
MSETKAKEARPKVRAPKVNEETKPFWDATLQGKLLIQKCEGCDKAFYYPRALCPYCFSDRTSWIETSGRGTIYSYSVQRRGTPEPYAIAYVRLEEGVSMLTNIIGCDFDRLRIGQAVKVDFVDTGEGSALPMFTPA